jgi:secreted PhoX family phosphatase
LFDKLDFTPSPVSHADDVVLANGFRYEVLLREGTVINPAGQRFGDNNDFLAILPQSETEGWMWVNHEKATLSFIADDWSKPTTREQGELMLRNMGGSCLRVKRDAAGKWRPVVPDVRNFRVDGLETKFQVTGPAAGSTYLKGAKTILGTLGNCGGAISPWGTFFSAEENYQDFWGDPEMKEAAPELAKHFDRPPEHYGYMIEIDPDTGECFKHTALGRFAHENIAFAIAADGRLVGYMGDDRQEQCLYKFISRDRYDANRGKANRELLNHGTLYAADTVNGRWLPLDPEQQPKLRKGGFDTARVCVNTRTAAKLAGASPLARPEDVERHPLTGDVFVCLTAYEAGKQPGGAAYSPEVKGALGRVREVDNDAGAMEFKFDIYLPGGAETGLVWPDNLSFTPQNHLLITSDFKLAAKPPAHSTQEQFGNNYLMVVPTSGANAGKVMRLGSGPCGAEFCSPTMSPDRGELWVSVQHPGDGSKSRAELISHWPDGGEAVPKSCVIAISRA